MRLHKIKPKDRPVRWRIGKRSGTIYDTSDRELTETFIAAVTAKAVQGSLPQNAGNIPQEINKSSIN